ncbi:uncharacterized protein LOC113474590 [Ciona intestinalis]
MLQFTLDEDILVSHQKICSGQILGFVVYINFAKNRCLLERNSEISVNNTKPYETLFNLLKDGEPRIIVVKVNAEVESGTAFSETWVALWLGATGVPVYDEPKLKQAAEDIHTQLETSGFLTLGGNDAMQLAERVAEICRKRVTKLHATPLAWSKKGGYTCC